MEFKNTYVINLEKELTWINLIYRISCWDKNIKNKILQKCNPAEKRLINLFSKIDPKDKKTWVDFNGQEMKNIISGCHDYYKKG